MPNKIVKNISTDELFISTEIKDWKSRFEAWVKDHHNPCPMPCDHYIFKYPSDYNCEPFDL